MSIGAGKENAKNLQRYASVVLSGMAGTMVISIARRNAMG